jgi:hypothetical protein
MAGSVQRVIAREHEDLAIKGAALTRELIDRTKARIGAIPDRDLSNALRNAATSTAIATDKALAARERPVAMPQRKRDIGEIVRSLEALGVARQVELPGP